MTIDKQKLQKLLWAEAASFRADCADWNRNAEALQEFLGKQTLEEVALELLAENDGLRKDKDRLEALESNFWGVRHKSSQIADTGDSSVSIEIVGHWMDKPYERVIGENYNENLRAAIDQAMKAPAYPPARPEYDFDEFPDFGGGSGNKARRRAESMGIDYDAAMGKEQSTACGSGQESEMAEGQTQQGSVCGSEQP